MVKKLFSRYSICLVNLGKTEGSEINKIRPCLIISPDEMNSILDTIIVAPMTTKYHAYPIRTEIRFENKRGWVVLDQIRTIDKRCIIKEVGKAPVSTINKIQKTLFDMFTI